MHRNYAMERYETFENNVTDLASLPYTTRITILARETPELLRRQHEASCCARSRPTKSSSTRLLSVTNRIVLAKRAEAVMSAFH
jgi:hypothetical protein